MQNYLVRENLRDRGSLIAYWPGEDTDASRVDDYNAEWETSFSGEEMTHDPL